MTDVIDPNPGLGRDPSGASLDQPVLVSSFSSAMAECEIQVREAHTAQGEVSYRAVAYQPGGSDAAAVVTDETGKEVEVIAATPSDAAERLAEVLELKFGPRRNRDAGTSAS